MASRRPIAPAVKAGDSTAPAGIDFSGLDRLLGYRLRRAQSAVHRDYNAMFEELKITQKQTGVMWLVVSNPGLAQGSIGASLGMDRATMMVLVDRLEARGLLKRIRSRKDARQRELFATPEGQRLMKKVHSLTERHEKRLKQLFTAAELQILEHLLERLQALECDLRRDS
jgi:MarR family transcriptional regulator, organic hydroperoxide resistance regulator